MGNSNDKNRKDYKLVLSLVLILIESLIVFMIISSLFVYNIFLLSLLLSITSLLVIILLIDIYPKLIGLIKRLSVLLLVVLFVSAFWAMFFGNGSFWYLKYSLGIVIGIISAFQLKTITSKYHQLLLLVFISTYAILFCEKVEYILALDPTLYGSILYPYTLGGVFNAILLLIGVNISAYFSYTLTTRIINKT